MEAAKRLPAKFYDPDTFNVISEAKRDSPKRITRPSKSLSEFELEEFSTISINPDEEASLSPCNPYLSPRTMWTRWFFDNVLRIDQHGSQNTEPTSTKNGAEAMPFFSKFHRGRNSQCTHRLSSSKVWVSPISLSQVGFWPGNPSQVRHKQLQFRDTISFLHRGTPFVVLPSSTCFSENSRAQSQIRTLRVSTNAKTLEVLSPASANGQEKCLEEIPLVSINWITNGVVSLEMAKHVPACLAMCCFSISFFKGSTASLDLIARDALELHLWIQGLDSLCTFGSSPKGIYVPETSSVRAFPSFLPLIQTYYPNLKYTARQSTSREFAKLSKTETLQEQQQHKHPSKQVDAVAFLSRRWKFARVTESGYRIIQVYMKEQNGRQVLSWDSNGGFPTGELRSAPVASVVSIEFGQSHKSGMFQPHHGLRALASLSLTLAFSEQQGREPKSWKFPRFLSLITPSEEISRTWAESLAEVSRIPNKSVFVPLPTALYKTIASKLFQAKFGKANEHFEASPPSSTQGKEAKSDHMRHMPGLPGSVDYM